MIACIVSVIWVIFGYSIAFKGSGSYFGDLSSLFLNGIARDSIAGSIPETLFVMFQMTFAIITPALVIGAFVERIKIFCCLFIHNILGNTGLFASLSHGLGRWISCSIGVIDFAGGLVVHVTCGVAALSFCNYDWTKKRFSKYPNATA